MTTPTASEPTAPLDLEAIRAVVDAAERGPWPPTSEREFIAVAHEALPALLSEVERLRAEISHFRDEWAIEGDSTWLWLTRILAGEPGDEYQRAVRG